MPGFSAYLKNPAFLISYFLTSYYQLLATYFFPLIPHFSFLTSCPKDKRIYYFFIYYLLFKMPVSSDILKKPAFLISYL